MPLYRLKDHLVLRLQVLSTLLLITPALAEGSKDVPPLPAKNKLLNYYGRKEMQL